MEKSHRNFGIGFLDLLTLLFIGLKLGGFIAWSWWWVLCPFWIPLVIAIVILLLVQLVTVKHG